MARFNMSDFNRKMRDAQRKVQQQVNREVDRINRENKRAVDNYNRKAKAHNKRVIDNYNRQVDAHNKRVIADYKARVRDHSRRTEAENRKLVSDINRKLRSASSPVRYSEQERQLADRVNRAVGTLDPREYDTFLSYARIDGSEVAGALREALEELGVAVWFDEIAIVPGRSQSLQMDAGLRKARSGIALLTPAYLTGRFWTERELGALLGKQTLIPVLHGVTFDDVKEYSGILPDLAGFSTESDGIETIAEKIAAAVLIEAGNTADD